MHAHAHHDTHGSPGSLNRLALAATLHCLTGCGIGEVLGLVIASWLGWGTVASIAPAVGLAFLFGYALAMRPLLDSGLSLGQALRLALAADTVSIAVMEIVDNAMMLAIPGAMDAAETRAERAEIRELARAIIADQQREIEQMQQWRQAWYGAQPAHTGH